jgi:hypothetical protein
MYTLNRYLKYLPGTALAFSKDELKDMLVQVHNPMYQALIMRANYNMDTHRFAQVTAYLDNLVLQKELLIKNKVQASHKKMSKNPLRRVRASRSPS